MQLKVPYSFELDFIGNGISHGVRSTESGNEFPTGSRCDLVIPTINSLKRSDSRFSRVTYSSGATPETAVERIYDKL